MRSDGYTTWLSSIQRDPHRLEKWAKRNPKKFSKGEGKVLHMGRNRNRHQCTLELASQKAAW